MPSLKGITVSVEQVNALSVLGISMGTGSTANGVEHRYVQGPLPEKNVAYWKSEGDIRVGDFHEAATIIRGSGGSGRRQVTTWNGPDGPAVPFLPAPIA